MQSILKYQALLNSKPLTTTQNEKDSKDVLLSAEEKAMALAIASAKLTAWSSLVAAETGQLDALAAYGEGCDDDYLAPAAMPKPPTGVASSVVPIRTAALLSTPFPFYKRNATTSTTTTDSAAASTPLPPTTTTTTMTHPSSTTPKQERRWSRRVTMEGEEQHQQRRLLLKKRKIM